VSTLEKFLSAFNKGCAWFVGRSQPREAINILVVTCNLKPERWQRVMSFPQRRILRTDWKRFREPSCVPWSNVLVSLGDSRTSINVDQLLLPGVTKAAD